MSICKYCGKEFAKKHNKQLYCCKECSHKATQDNKAKYQRKRRKRIREKELISNETQKIGTIHFPKETGNWDLEKKYIERAKRNARII